MKFGLHLGTRGVAATPDGIRAVAQRCEQSGFDYFGFNDHVVIARQVDSRYPYSDSGIWPAADTGTCLEQITALTYVAGVTDRLRLLTSVMVLPHRPPVLAAKMLSTLDVLSNGRLTVGVGVGWMEEEFSALQTPAFTARGAVSNEYIRAFQALWTEDAPRVAGEYVQFDELLFAPKPVQAPHPPIWIGGEGPAARRRAAALGDGWYPVGRNPHHLLDTPARFSEALVQVRQQAEALGRDPSGIDTAMFAPWFQFDLSPAREKAGRLPFTGAAQRIIEDVAAFSAAGLNHLIIGFESNVLTEALDRIDRFGTEVIAAVG